MKEKFSGVVKYWPKDSQMLQQVMREDSRITAFPQRLFTEIGSLDEIVQNVVIFSAFAGKDEAQWGRNCTLGQIMINDLQEKFTHHAGIDRRVTYVVNRVEGFYEDVDLFRFLNLSAMSALTFHFLFAYN